MLLNASQSLKKSQQIQNKNGCLYTQNATNWLIGWLADWLVSVLFNSFLFLLLLSLCHSHGFVDWLLLFCFSLLFLLLWNRMMMMIMVNRHLMYDVCVYTVCIYWIDINIYNTKPHLCTIYTSTHGWRMKSEKAR